MRVPELSLSDRLIFALTNILVYLRYPLLGLRYRLRQGRWADLARPRRYTELAQWRKVFDRNPQFPVFSDKLAAKEWIATRFPDLAMTEVVWVGARYQDVPDRYLSPEFVIKLNNTSSANYFPHRQGTSRDSFTRAVKSWQGGPVRRWLGQASRQEWGYLPVQPKVFVERRIMAEPLIDFSVRACNGKSLVVACATGLKTDAVRLAYFWPDGTRIDSSGTADRDDLDTAFQIPPRFAEAMQVAERISRGFDFLRVDFLAAGDQLFVGEVTLYPSSGFTNDAARTEIVYRHWLEGIDLAWPLQSPQPWWMSVYLGAFRRWLARRKAELGPAAAFLADVRSGKVGDGAP